MVTDQEMEILAKQLGRRPRGVRAIEKYCPLGHPQVIRVYPLVDGKPFPTLFWLTCPTLIQQISRLEYQGVMEIVERFIQEDVSFQEHYHQDHRTYIKERWSELAEHDRRWVEAQGLSSVFLERGIGGVGDWNTVKCLHMHYAHHRARGSAIGRWLDEEYTLVECATKS